MRYCRSATNCASSSGRRSMPIYRAPPRRCATRATRRLLSKALPGNKRVIGRQFASRTTGPGPDPEVIPGNARSRHGVFPIPARRVRAGLPIRERFHEQIQFRILCAGPCRRGLRFGYSPCLRHPGPCPAGPCRFQRRRQRKRTLHDLAAPLPRPSPRSRLGVPALHDPARLQVTARRLPRESTLVCGGLAVRTPHFLSLPRFGPAGASLARAGAGGPFALPAGTGA